MNRDRPAADWLDRPHVNRPAPLPTDWFEPGDLVTRLGDDRHIVINTNEQPGDTYPPDLVKVLCVRTGAATWCKQGDIAEYTIGDLELIRRGDGTIGAPLKQLLAASFDPVIDRLLALFGGKSIEAPGP